MSEKTIVMSYHPALKKVRFLSENNEDISAKYSPLEKWTHKSIVLQEQGDAFFNDLIYATDGVQILKIIFNGTDVDFEDFSSMAEYYNKKNSRKIKCIRGKTLPDMDIMFKEIEKLGKTSVDILNKKIYEIPHSAVTYQVEENLTKCLKEHISRISNKIEKLSSSNINICFVGTYSSGKSSVINSILRERILPEADESKTAKFFVISTPSDGIYGIEFKLRGTKTKISWNGHTLQLDDNYASHEFRIIIQENIDKHRNEHMSNQFYNVLELLNSSEDVGIEIKVFYNIPINSNEFSFTIYDTPGTGSNTSEHKDILESALADQENSIVVFVGAVTKLEGEGNSDLLKLLNNDNNSRIDLDRSLFVINRADTTYEEELEEYTYKQIELKDTDMDDTSEKIKIPLRDKKLFFVSAAQASAAMAFKSNKQTKKDEHYYRTLQTLPDNYYKFDHYGNSEMATDRMREAAFKAEKQADSEYDKAYIRVGLYSLVEAIKEYGRKYALAVKVNALVTAVEESLKYLLDFASTQEDFCNEKINNLDNELERVRTEITQKVNFFHDKRIIKDGVIPDEMQRRLQIDSDNQEKLDEDITKALNKLLMSGKKHNVKKRNVKTKYIGTEEIYEMISEHLKNFNVGFDMRMIELLEENKELFLNEVKIIIKSDSELSDATKNRLLIGLDRNTELTDKKKKLKLSNIDNIIKGNTQSHRFLFWSWETVDVYRSMNEIQKVISAISIDNSIAFANHFNSNYNNLLNIICNNFNANVDEFSVEIRGIKDDREHMMKIVGVIKNTANQINEQNNSLEKTAWGIE